MKFVLTAQLFHFFLSTTFSCIPGLQRSVPGLVKSRQARASSGTEASLLRSSQGFFRGGKTLGPVSVRGAPLTLTGPRVLPPLFFAAAVLRTAAAKKPAKSAAR